MSESNGQEILENLLSEARRFEQSQLYAAVHNRFEAMRDKIRSQRDVVIVGTPEQAAKLNHLKGQEDMLAELLQPCFGLTHLITQEIVQTRAVENAFEQLQKQYPKDIKTREDAAQYLGMADPQAQNLPHSGQ